MLHFLKKHSSFLVLSSGVFVIRGGGALSVFFLFVLLSQNLSIDDFAAFSYVYYIIPFCAVLLNFGFSQTIMHKAPNFIRENRPQKLFFIIYQSILFSFFIGIFLFLTLFFLEETFSNEGLLIKYKFHIISISIFYSLVSTLQGLMRIRGRALVGQFFEQLCIPFCLILFTFFYIHGHVNLYLFLYIAIFFILLFLNKDVFNFSIKGSSFFKTFKSPPYLYFCLLSMLLMNRLDVLYLGADANSFTPEDIAVYNSAARIASIIFILQSGFQVITDKIIYNCEQNRIFILFKNLFIFYSSVSCVGFLILYFLSPYLAGLFVKNHDVPTYLVRILLLGQVLNFCYGYAFGFFVRAKILKTVFFILFSFVAFMIGLFVFWGDENLEKISSIYTLTVLLTNVVLLFITYMKLRKLNA